MPLTDADALPLLIDVMAAAGRHDGPECLHLLDEAESHLGPGFHQARDAIDAARRAAHDSQWVAVWRGVLSATRALTWAFPPDPSLCPPMPGDEPYLDEACVCGVAWDPTAAFCSTCGARR